MCHVPLPPRTPLLAKALTGSRWPSLRDLAPSRIKKLIEHFGTAERVFQASLTELEAMGMRAVSAQSLATGKSLELAQQECAKAARRARELFPSAIPNIPRG